MAVRGRPRTVRPVDLKVLTGPELRNIVALMPDLYTPSEAYAMQQNELGRAILLDNGEAFRRIDLSKLNEDVFRSKSVMAYVVGLQDYVNGSAAERPRPPQASADSDEDGSLSAPAALEAYRAKVKAAKAAEKAAAMPAAPEEVQPVAAAVEPPPADDRGGLSGATPIEQMEAAIADVKAAVGVAAEKLALLRALIIEHLN